MMESVGFDEFDEEALFEAEAREIASPSRKHIVLHEKLNATGKQKLANQSRFGRRHHRATMKRTSPRHRR